MGREQDFGRTERGRPCKPGCSRRFTIRLREGEPDDDAILQRLARLPVGQRSAYIRRVLTGAPVEDLEEPIVRESVGLTVALDGMWAEEWEDEERE